MSEEIKTTGWETVARERWRGRVQLRVVPLEPKKIYSTKWSWRVILTEADGYTQELAKGIEDNQIAAQEAADDWLNTFIDQCRLKVGVE